MLLALLSANGYDSDWCVLPVSNIEAYLGSSALNKQYMSKIPAEFMQKKETSYGISVCKIIFTNIK